MNLTKLARKAIEKYFDGEIYDPDAKTKQKYTKKGACFITLTKNWELRGCVGSLLAHQQLYKDVIRNAINAAFKDYRFEPLHKTEMSSIKIEVSVLTIPKDLQYKNENDLLSKLNPSMGLILEKYNHSATFLPQVWTDLPDKKEFLEELGLKAGLDRNDWKSSHYKYYRVKKYKE